MFRWNRRDGIPRLARPALFLLAVIYSVHLASALPTSTTLATSTLSSSSNHHQIQHASYPPGSTEDAIPVASLVGIAVGAAFGVVFLALVMLVVKLRRDEGRCETHANHDDSKSESESELAWDDGTCRLYAEQLDRNAAGTLNAPAPSPAAGHGCQSSKRPPVPHNRSASNLIGATNAMLLQSGLPCSPGPSSHSANNENTSQDYSLAHVNGSLRIPIASLSDDVACAQPVTPAYAASIPKHRHDCGDEPSPKAPKLERAQTSASQFPTSTAHQSASSQQAKKHSAAARLSQYQTMYGLVQWTTTTPKDHDGCGSMGGVADPLRQPVARSPSTCTLQRSSPFQDPQPVSCPLPKSWDGRVTLTSFALMKFEGTRSFHQAVSSRSGWMDMIRHKVYSWATCVPEEAQFAEVSSASLGESHA